MGQAGIKLKTGYNVRGNMMMIIFVTYILTTTIFMKKLTE
jgi:hypothetical protein